MTLQFKFALYNSLTKIVIILLMGFFTSISVERLSLFHINTKLADKRDKFSKNIGSFEIESLSRANQPYQGYNILREEFIFIKQVSGIQGLKDTYRTEVRNIDGQKQEYRVLIHPFTYEKVNYILEIGETIEGVKALERSIQTFTIVLLIAALALTLILDIVFTGVLLKPFYRIIDEKIRNTNDPGHFNYQVVNTTTRDFQQLDESVSNLMKKMNSLFSTQRQFIANVSHELLTPISIMRIRIENILTKEALDEDLENKLYANLKTLNRLKSLVNNLLLISKIENNQYPQRDTFPLEGLITDTLEELEDRIADKEITVDKQLQPFTFNGSFSLIQILLFNIINNAIKYNRQQGHIYFTGKKSANMYELHIRDTGLGMTDDEVSKAFNRFEKLDSTESDSHGLGLAIVKSIANFHHIVIQVNTSSNGTDFRLDFPV